ncbi:MAG: HD domain-containing protein [Gammaproteobacteria bacterium]|nr:HD domain-containing protein [Gammaproteobacteria bacterium]
MPDKSIDIITQTTLYVQNTLKNDSSHDWWHIYRVWKNAKFIGQYEKANLLVVELAALLHDIADWKFHNGDLKAGARITRGWLLENDIDSETIDHVCHIVENTSFKGANVNPEPLTLEGLIVQDADRLDAIGAIGIARAFAYGGHKGRSMYEPDIKPQLHNSFEEYKSNQSPTINHFYEKLLLLKDNMNTQTGKLLAERKHNFMEQYLQEFYTEWETNYSAGNIS